MTKNSFVTELTFSYKSSMIIEHYKKGNFHITVISKQGFFQAFFIISKQCLKTPFESQIYNWNFQR